jgi:hypothetical protein
MHKKKNRERVLAGEMILSFYKSGPGSLPSRQQSRRLTIEELTDETLAQVSPDQRPFAGELLFNRMIVKAWENGALDSLDVSREHFTEVLTRKGWRYNAVRHQWFHTLQCAPAGFQFTF